MFQKSSLKALIVMSFLVGLLPFISSQSSHSSFSLKQHEVFHPPIAMMTNIMHGSWKTASEENLLVCQPCFCCVWVCFALHSEVGQTLKM